MKKVEKMIIYFFLFFPVFFIDPSFNIEYAFYQL